MKKWYIKCPFCANEIKQWAQKCQYCKEYLDSSKSDGDNVVAKIKDTDPTNNSFWYKFFRKDLDLSSKRWHRLFKIIWILTVIIWCIIVFWYVSDEYPSYEPYFQLEWSVIDRITTWTVAPADVVKEWEYLSPYCSAYKIPSLEELIRGDSKIKNDFTLCCAKEWNTDTVYSCFKHELYWRGSHYWPNWWGWTIWEVSENAKGYACMVEILADWKPYMSFDDWWNAFEKASPCIFTYHEANKFGLFMHRLITDVWLAILYLLLYCCITIFIYYKWIIYIIYGKK